jgi:hypothetical protein
MIVQRIEKTKSGAGFSGLTKSNIGTERRTMFQPSSFIGNWLSVGGYSLTGNPELWKHGTFNANGHLLYTSKEK